jgi:hypothetical protein
VVSTFIVFIVSCSITSPHDVRVGHPCSRLNSNAAPQLRPGDVASDVALLHARFWCIVHVSI